MLAKTQTNEFDGDTSGENFMGKTGGELKFPYS